MSTFAILGIYAAGVIALAVAVLVIRDRVARAHRKTPVQVRARWDSLVELSRVMKFAAPGLLIIAFGAFFVWASYTDGSPDWWLGLLAIAVGWFLVPLFARRSWRRYVELRRVADGDDEQQSSDTLFE